MLIKNISIENAPPRDIRIENGVFAEIAAGLSPRAGERIIDGGGMLALAPFVESHVHLDTCLTAGDPEWNISGTLFEGIECWLKRKAKLTHEDVKSRATAALKMYAAHGVQYVRTHVDVSDPNLTAIKAMVEVREACLDFVTLQIVAFPQEGILSFPNAKALLNEAIAIGADAVGAIPHYEFTREYGVESLNYAVKLAEKHGVLVDVHCDEIDDESARGLETLAARAYESGMKERVTAGHTTAMHSYNNAYAQKLMRLLSVSGVNFVANPLVNIHLQGRLDAYPKRRGLTRVKELLLAGCNVSFGQDDIFDPFYPLGDGNLRDAVFMGLHACQMLGHDDIMNAYKLITTNGARTLNLGEKYGIKVGNPADMVIIDAPNYSVALNRNSKVAYSIKGGRPISCVLNHTTSTG